MVRLFGKWLPIADCLIRRGMVIDSSCFCCDSEESLHHLFVSGPVASSVWGFFHSLMGWPNDKRMKNIPFTSDRVCSRIWNYIETIKVVGKHRFGFWKDAENITHFLGIKVDFRIARKVSMVHWLKPPIGWMKLNTDGAARGNPGLAAAGGIIRDSCGKPLLCFWEFIGAQSNTFADLHGIWRGLQLCCEKGIDNIWVEVDSAIALRMIHNNSTSQWQSQAIISKIHILLDKLNTRFSHIFREGNSVADFLANQGCDHRNFFCSEGRDLRGRILGLIRLDKM
ncbi:hypothetical protein OROMI_010479 [Orobanche minor]